MFLFADGAVYFTFVREDFFIKSFVLSVCITIALSVCFALFLPLKYDKVAFSLSMFLIVILASSSQLLHFLCYVNGFKWFIYLSCCGLLVYALRQNYMPLKKCFLLSLFTFGTISRESINICTWFDYCFVLEKLLTKSFIYNMQIIVIVCLSLKIGLNVFEVSFIVY